MHIRAYAASLLGALSVLSVAPAIASADALAVSCAGTPGVASITWSATATGGVAPIDLLWGNGATTTSQVVSYAPGLQSISIQATDASSTVATSTCSATVLAAPVISSFIATPPSVNVGSSAVLSWNVSGASSLSISGIGAVTGTMATVTPSATTNYILTATNSGGSSTSSATVTVTAVGTTSPSVVAQIQALLAQIAALKAQIAQLVSGALTGTGTTTPAAVPGVRFCLETDHDMRLGDDGDDVRSLQQVLASDPSIFPEGQVTGFFGPKTLKAVQKFQKKFGVSSTGFVGLQTRSLFHSHCGQGLVQMSAGSTSSTTIGIPPGLLKKAEDDHGSNRGRGNGRGGDDD